MPSRLSSLLVRDGLVGVKRMEKAFQRQVIYGGSLDTILLEMNLLPEDRLTQYLALASGLPPAKRDEGNTITSEALALIDAEIAAQFRAIPVSLDGEALRVLVCSPLEISELEDLADLLDRPLQPLITPEYRWHLVYANAYRVDAPARFTTLARQQSGELNEAPVGRAPSVIVEDSAPVHVDPAATAPVAAAAAAVPQPVTEEAATERVVYDLPLERGRQGTLAGVPVSRTRTASGPLVAPRPPAQPSPPAPSPAASPPASLTPAPSTASGAVLSTVAAPVTPSTGVPRAFSETARTGRRGVVARPSIEPIAAAGRDSPLAFVRARELLATADDRDTVFLTLLRAARARARYAGLLTVQGGAAIGRIALADTGIDAATIANVLIPLDVVSPYRAVTQHKQPHIGSLVSGDPGIDAMTLRLGGTMPPSALLMPIVLRDRVVAIVIAHRGHSDLKLADVTELLPLAAGAADALGRLIVKHKSAGYRAPQAQASAPVVELERIETKKLGTGDAQWRAPAPASRPSIPEIPIVAEVTPSPVAPPRLMEVVLDTIENAAEGGAEAEISDAVERAAEALGELAKRFPGKLRIDRFAVAGRPLRAAQYGGLLELVVRLGPAAAELVIDRMGSPQRDVRFYAIVCAAELRLRNAIFALVERVFDQDFGVRSMAIEALRGYPHGELSHALARARRAVHASDPDTVVAATAAIVQLADVEAVDDLISAIERGDRGAEHARKALIALTAQDFGLSERKWRKWYDGARRRHRIEWLIEGLGSKDDGIREAAINDLRRMTGEYFGYHHDLPKKEREVAAERWAAWWRETGQRRFVHREDERHRPTAVLPARRD